MEEFISGDPSAVNDAYDVIVDALAEGIDGVVDAFFATIPDVVEIAMGVFAGVWVVYGCVKIFRRVTGIGLPEDYSLVDTADNAAWVDSMAYSNDGEVLEYYYEESSEDFEPVQYQSGSVYIPTW